MSLPFLICGLPRSRTAWLANFLYYGNSSCLHELMSKQTVSGLFHCLTKDGTKFSGNSDTAQTLFMEDILRLMPDAPIVVVKRDSEDVLRSLHALGIHLGRNCMEPLVGALSATEKLPNTLAVRYEDLSSEATLRAIQSHCCPGEPFNRERTSMLIDTNIQITTSRWAYLFERAALNYATQAPAEAAFICC